MKFGLNIRINESVTSRDGNRSGRPAGRVTGRVEILRPAGKPVETPVKFSFLATKRHLCTNKNIHIDLIINNALYKRTVLTKHSY